MLPLQVFLFLIFLVSVRAINLYGPPKQATLQERPFQAAIMRNGVYRCSASIISSNCVITAYSCAEDKSNPNGNITDFYTIVTYTRNLNAGLVYSADATMAFFTEGHNPHTNENDAAILCSDEYLVGTPVTLVKEETKDNVRGIVSGWGISVKGQKIIQNSLQRAYMKIISLDECRRRYAGVRMVPDSALCAVAPDEVRGFCGGDIGGPLTHGVGLIGIAVTNFGCGRFKYPGIFTNVSKLSAFMDFTLTDK